MKKTTRLLPILLLSSSATVAVAAEEFDGSKPLVCTPQSGHDCLPGESMCKPLKAKPGKDLHVRISIADMSVRTPYRNTELPIHAFNNNTKALTLQGTTLDLVWSAAIFRQTGKITIAIADREGAHVIFGQCKIDSAQPQSQAQ
jgi:hypothetical protein